MGEENWQERVGLGNPSFQPTGDECQLLILRHVAVGASHWCCQCYISVPHWNELLDLDVLS